MSLIQYSQFAKDFIKLQEVGRGNCAAAYKIKQKATDQIFIVKETVYDRFSQYGECVCEIEILKTLKDEATPQLYFYYFKDDFDERHPSVKTNTHVGMIMEYCDRTLCDEIKDIQTRRIHPYTADELWTFTKEMVRFFAKMQRMELMHRDIKPHNIMIKVENQIKKYKVIDFGYSLKKSKYSSENITGTEEYASPKVKFKFEDHKRYVPGITEKDDVFSLGKTILELTRAKNTKNNEITEKLFQRLSSIYDPNIIGIIERMLEKDENKRWDFIRIEDEMLKIESLKQTNSIMLDESMIEENECLKGVLEPQSQNLHSSSQARQSSSRIQGKKSKTVEIQTQNQTYEEFLPILGDKFKKKGPASSFEETIYIANERKQESEAQSSVCKLFQNRCSFENQIHSMKVFDDFVLFGMVNSIGVVSLKHKNDAIYVMRPKQLEGQKTPTIFNQIRTFGDNIVFICTSENFFYCDINELVSKMRYLFENHQDLVKARILKQKIRKSIGSVHQYREPNIFEFSYDYFRCGFSSQRISCIDSGKIKFWGIENTVLMGHYDGSISIYERGVIYKNEYPITDLEVIDRDRIIFYTPEGCIKLIEFKSDPMQQPIKYSQHVYNTKNKINFFKVFDTQNQKKQGRLEPVLVEVYLKNGKMIMLNNEMEQITIHTLFRKVEINKVVDTQWVWNMKTIERKSQTEPFIFQRKTPHQDGKNKFGKETYLITQTGKLIGTSDDRTVFDFGFADTSSVFISDKLIVASSYQGKVALINSEFIFDNSIKPHPKIDKKITQSKLTIIQKPENTVRKQKMYVSKQNQEQDYHSEELLHSLQSRQLPTYSQALIAKSRGINFARRLQRTEC